MRGSVCSVSLSGGGQGSLASQTRQGPARRVPRQQEAQRGGAGAGKAEAEQRVHDALFVDFGIRAVALLDPEPIDQVADDLVRHRCDPQLAQRRLGVQRVDQHLEAFAPGVSAEVVTPGALARSGDELVRFEVVLAHPSSSLASPEFGHAMLTLAASGCFPQPVLASCTLGHLPEARQRWSAPSLRHGPRPVREWEHERTRGAPPCSPSPGNHR